ncbi:sulfotransferase [Waterburya agarophytonicola K14]|uniref:Sulfotransferase n=1 Tax=Waterburya agarophytonicola KI4 TaxID=2874699 RepID=A0A964BXN0_9CYAN|nr:sulfotransferase [Waterburya agarophytonicola]MCC0179477.1 sulfotransferase [Waterburya agarophytonicola KI4]
MNNSNVHLISGLPRSGSTLLAALLKQNPQFHGGMTSPVGNLMNRMLESTSEEQEGSVFITPEQKRELLLAVFNTYYKNQIAQGQTIFDTNRLWCSKLPLVTELFPDAKIICCVRNIAWIMDSIERLVRKNVFDVSKMFNRGEGSTVFSRTDALSQGNRMVGFAYNALKEAFYSEQADRLLLIDYDLLTCDPEQVMRLIYRFIQQPYYSHDFNNVEYAEPEFDKRLGTPGLHTVKRKVEYTLRQTVLPPDLFERFGNLTFWQDVNRSLAHVVCVQPEVSKKQMLSSLSS